MLIIEAKIIQRFLASRLGIRITKIISETYTLSLKKYIFKVLKDKI